MTTIKEYIEMDNVVLNENKLSVLGASTNFIDHTKVKKFTLKELSNLHSEVVKLCKANKIKVSYKNKSKQFFTELFKSGEYEKLYNRYDLLFNKLYEGWKIQREKGFYYGFAGEDFYINELQQPLFDLTAMFYRDQPLHKLNVIEYRLNDLKQRIQETPEEFYSITL